jgi:acyl carrier protein phosphodiesterase
VNFLAHFHLAWPDEGLVAGALEGDYYKGPLRDTIAEPLARGIKLHRAIDAYTDDHPVVVELRQQFPKDLRRYSGIVIDLAFDHYLSQCWQQYASVPLPQFNQNVLAVLHDQRHQLSESAQRMHLRMEQYSILTRYTDWQMVSASARRVGERFRRGNPFLDLEPSIVPLRSTLQHAFDQFYPDLVDFCAEKRTQL